MKTLQKMPIHFLHSLLSFTFYLLIFSLSFLQPFQYIYQQRIPFTDFLFVISAFIFLILVVFKQISLKWHKIYWLFLIYLLAIFTSIFFSDNKSSSFVKFLGEVYLIGLAIFTFNFVLTIKHLRVILQVWLCGTFIVCFIGLLSIFLFYFQPDNQLLDFTLNHYGAVPVGNYPRICSTFLSASMFCNYLSVSLVFLLICIKNKWINIGLFFVLFLSILINAVFTISSGLGSFVLILCFWFWYLNKDKFPKFSKLSLFCGIFIPIIFFFLNFIALQKYPTVPFGIQLPFVEKVIYPSSRYLVWKDSLQTFLENPVFGVGIGQNSCQVIFQNTDGSYSLLTDAHNIFLSVATQTGFFGLICFLLVIFYILKECFPFERTASEISTVRFGLGIAFISAFIYQGFIGSFEETRHLWVLIGLILSINSLYFNDENSDSNL